MNTIMLFSCIGTALHAVANHVLFLVKLYYIINLSESLGIIGLFVLTLTYGP
jgi:hypothetical protein